jgi:hypothetical protein
VGVLGERARVALHDRDREQDQHVSLGDEPAFDSEPRFETGDDAAGNEHDQCRQRRHQRQGRRPAPVNRLRHRLASDGGPHGAQHDGGSEEPEDPPDCGHHCLARLAPAEQACQHEQADRRE